MKHIYKIVFSFLLIAATVVPTVVAQHSRGWNGYMRRNEVSVNMDLLGIGKVPYTSSYDWDCKFGFNMSFGVNYTYWFGTHFGITTGASITYMSVKERLSDFSALVDGYVDVENNYEVVSTPAKFRVTADRLEDHQTYGFFQVPLQASFTTGVFYANVGLALAVPFSSYGKYDIVKSDYQVVQLDNSGIELAKPIDVSPIQSKKDEYEPNDINEVNFCMLATDFGLRFNLDACNMLSLGLYFNYALNKNDVSAFDDEIATIASATSDINAPMATSLVDSYRYFNIGFRLAYHIGVGSSAAKRSSVIY